MKLLIVLRHRFGLWNAPAWLSERLRQDFPGVEVVQRSGYEGIEAELADTEVAITWSLRAEQFRAARRLRWIHSTAAAVHQLMFPELVESEVLVTNARAVHGPVVAEHALAMMFAVAKKIPQTIRLQIGREWGQERLWRDPPRPRELKDAVLALVGAGSIGREIARRASALDMRVLVVREHAEKQAHGADAIYGPERLTEALREADFLILAAPLTAATHHLVNATTLAQMKPDAYLVNVSRGALVNEPELIEALRAGRIAGAALDVFEREPLAADSPLWDMENVLITPHTAAVTEKLWERQYALIRENVRRYRAGQALLGLVDKRKGY